MRITHLPSGLSVGREYRNYDCRINQMRQELEQELRSKLSNSAEYSGEDSRAQQNMDS